MCSWSEFTEAHTNLDAVLKDVSREWETFLPINWLTEDDQLLKQEDPSFLCPGQEATVLFGNSEGVLLEQLALGCDLPLVPQQKINTTKRGSGYGVVFMDWIVGMRNVLKTVTDGLNSWDVPQSLVVCPHSSCHCNVLAQSTSLLLLSV